MTRFTLALLMMGLVVAAMNSMAVTDQALHIVEKVDLERYQGRWYEIARLPNRFQEQCDSDISAHYRLRDDGRIDVTNRCRKPDGSWSQAEGVARKADRDGPDGALEVRFAPRWLSLLPFVWGDYRILALGRDYDHALVGSENRKYLWILSRSPEPGRDMIERLERIAEQQGYDISRLLYTTHTNE